MSGADARGRVILGVSGGIAVYKACEVLRGFQREGFDVSVVMTEAATAFVAPLTFAALSGHPVSHGRVGRETDANMAHVDVTRGADLFVVAPATANVLGKLAHGLADDWLTTHFLANEAPVLLAPAMNQRMWRHRAVVDNLERLRRRGAVVVQPEEGDLACGEVGAGRLAEPAEIVARGVELARRPDGALLGRSVLVTSGPTYEDWDEVRFVGNRSSGKMGRALAAEAARRGARVVLVTGPTSLPPPAGCEVVAVRTADEMAEAVAERLGEADLAIFAAAVADYRPEVRREGKLRRGESERLSLELVRTRDVLGESVAARPAALLVGFAAETADPLASGRRKLAEKGCDVLVANRVGGADCAFDADENEVWLLGPDGDEVHVPRAAKAAVAGRLLDEIGTRLRRFRRRGVGAS